MRRILAAVLILAAIIVAAFAVYVVMRPEKPSTETPAAGALVAPEGFQHDSAFEVSGFYMPIASVQVGQLKLNHMAMGARSDFESWEAGEREAVYGPIMLQFDDLSSPTVTNELGGEGHERTIRILPDRYRLYPGEVSFHGVDATLGEVTFVGTFNQEALAGGQRDTSSGETAALTGDLQIGEQRFDDVGFTFWIGD